METLCEPRGAGRACAKVVAEQKRENWRTLKSYSKQKDKAGSDQAWATSCLALLGPLVISRWKGQCPNPPILSLVWVALLNCLWHVKVSLEAMGPEDAPITGVLG